jgi:hypothetical protein
MVSQSSSKTFVQLPSLMFLLAMLAAPDCWACYSPPATQLMSAYEQVMRSSDVSVAQVISMTPLEGREVEYRFVVLQRLAGQDRYSFTVTGHAAARNDKDTTFDNHTDLDFWKRGRGRVMNDSDCVIHPSFVVGASYLVFLGSPATWRSYEKIEVVNGGINDGDKWLAYVKAGLDNRTKS